MTSEKWWQEVVLNTYLYTEGLNQLDEGEIRGLMPTVFPLLYKEVFGTKTGWTVKEDVIYTLNKLIAWCDQGSGPKLAVISNFDDRLSNILAGTNVQMFSTLDTLCRVCFVFYTVL
jgi:hypothetical protein